MIAKRAIRPVTIRACIALPALMVAMALLAVIASATVPLALDDAAGASTIPRITHHGSRLYAGNRPWRAWGMNWGLGDHAPVISYFDNPTPQRLATLKAELRIARRMGANSMRVYLELGQVMGDPDRAAAADARRAAAIAATGGERARLPRHHRQSRLATPACAGLV